jgi:protease-4
MSRSFLLVFLVALVVVFLLLLWVGEGVYIHDGSALVLDLGAPIEEQRPGGAIGELTGPRVLLMHQISTALRVAKNDPRIAGLVVKIAPLDAGWGKAEEIRELIRDFSKSKKPSICYLEGEIIGNREYFLASGCDQVWIIPSGVLGTTGMMAQSTFYKGTLEKLGIEPNVFGIAEYKTYRNQFTEKKYTAAHRESAEGLLRSIFDHYVAQGAQARKMKREEFLALLEQGPYLPAEAQENKLLDKVAYWDEVRNYFDEKHDGWEPVEVTRYFKQIPNTGFESIAVVRASGDIVMGGSGYDSWSGFIMGSDSVIADLRRAREDDSVKAIVLRIDSGGGSAAASELIRREVELAMDAKPVVVSMADVAASGGYWIAMSAKRIIAEPTTVTGSIGVVFGKMNVSGLYTLLGLSTDHVATHENATILWEQQNFTPAQRESVMKFMDDTYANFTAGVAEGRGLKPEAVEKIARGRVWSGAQARGFKLVDEFGGLDRAIAVARDLAKIDADRAVRILMLPQEKTVFQELFERANTESIQSDPLRTRLRRLTKPRELVQARLPFELTIR